MKRKDFEQCMKDETLVETDTGGETLAKELLCMAEHRLDFWKEAKQKAKGYPTLFLEGYYEIIKELATAILALDGWMSLDHECLFAYLKHERQELEVDFNYLSDLKDTRNEISYRGLKLNYKMLKDNELKIQLTINAMREYLTNKLQQQSF